MHILGEKDGGQEREGPCEEISPAAERRER